MRIKLSYSFATEPIFRQTPGGLGIWKGDEFFHGDHSRQDCDIWTVLEDLGEPQTSFVRSGRAILVTLEPPLTRKYEPGYLAQFDLVVSCHRHLGHPNVRNEYQGQPWHIGMHKGADAIDRTNFRATLGYDDFLAMRPPRKTSDLSVICSASTRLPGHRARLEFVDKLRARLGDRIDAFGRGMHPVADKAAAILPYRYHVALENTRMPDYWTEKLADAFLGWSFPIYWGCENVGDYFPRDSLIEIDISKPNEAIDLIETVMSEELGPERSAALAAARSLVLDRYNTFDDIRRACLSLPPAAERSIVLRPQRDFRPSKARRLLRRAVRKFPLGSRGK